MGRLQRYQFSDAELVVLSDGTAAFPSEFVMVGTDEQERIDACRRWGYDTNAVASSTNVIYINFGSTTVLFDTGAGMTLPGCGQLPESLSEAGIDPEAIDVVIHTHLHLDHTGWNVTADGAPMFPNARFCIGQIEYDFWSSEETLRALRRSDLWRLPDFEPAMADAFLSNVKSLRDRTEIFPDDGQPIPGIQAMPAYGHTPGHLAYAVNLGGESLLVAGDFALNPVHLERPQWFSAVDLNPATAIESRERVLRHAADSGMLIAGYHLPFPGVGRVTRSGPGWTWEPA